MPVNHTQCAFIQNLRESLCGKARRKSFLNTTATSFLSDETPNQELIKANHRASVVEARDGDIQRT